jgi:hypothetical protein
MRVGKCEFKLGIYFILDSTETVLKVYKSESCQPVSFAFLSLKVEFEVFSYCNSLCRI